MADAAGIQPRSLTGGAPARGLSAGVGRFITPRPRNHGLFLGLLVPGLGWPFLLRSGRAQGLSLKEGDYVEGAGAVDLSPRYILFREILPNMMTYIVISFLLATTGAIYAEVGLIFLGL